MTVTELTVTTTPHSRPMFTPEWAEDGACVDKPQSWFFLSDDLSWNEQRRQEKYLPGIKVCRGCEVKEQCLAFALRHDERHGIWGGLTTTERRALRRAKLQLVSA